MDDWALFETNTHIHCANSSQTSQIPAPADTCPGEATGDGLSLRLYETWIKFLTSSLGPFRLRLIWVFGEWISLEYIISSWLARSSDSSVLNFLRSSSCHNVYTNLRFQNSKQGFWFLYIQTHLIAFAFFFYNSHSFLIHSFLRLVEERDKVSNLPFFLVHPPSDCNSRSQERKNAIQSCHVRA